MRIRAIVSEHEKLYQGLIDSCRGHEECCPESTTARARRVAGEGRDGLRLLEREELENAAKVAALRDAADKGWLDLATGRYDDIADENLDDFIGELGGRAARASSTG